MKKETEMKIEGNTIKKLLDADPELKRAWDLLNEAEDVTIAKAINKAEDTQENYKETETNIVASPVFYEMDSYVDMVKRGLSYGCIIEGRGGTGKTYRTLAALQDLDFAYSDSFTTPAAFYIWMYENRDKDVLIVDDVVGMMNNPKILGFLKGALWPINKKDRVVNYMTTKPLKNALGDYIPQYFEINARLIMICNEVKTKNANLNAVITRINYCKVNIDYTEMINILSAISNMEYNGLSQKERTEVFEYLKKKTSMSTSNLNIRSMIQMFNQKIYSNKIKKPNKWKELTMLGILGKDPNMVIIEAILKDEKLKNDKDRIKQFNIQTGKSRATYYRFIRKLGIAGVEA